MRPNVIAEKRRTTSNAGTGGPWTKAPSNAAGSFTSVTREDVRSTDDDRLRISIRNVGGDAYWVINARDIATTDNLRWPQAVNRYSPRRLTPSSSRSARRRNTSCRPQQRGHAGQTVVPPGESRKHRLHPVTFIPHHRTMPPRAQNLGRSTPQQDCSRSISQLVPPRSELTRPKHISRNQELRR